MKNDLSTIRQRLSGWQLDALDYIQSADLKQLRFSALAQSVKDYYSEADEKQEAEIAAAIAAFVVIRIGGIPSQSVLRKPTGLLVIALGIGSVGEEIGLTPRGNRELSEALEEAGLKL